MKLKLFHLYLTENNFWIVLNSSQILYVIDVLLICKIKQLEILMLNYFYLTYNRLIIKKKSLDELNFYKQ